MPVWSTQGLGLILKESSVAGDYMPVTLATESLRQEDHLKVGGQPVIESLRWPHIKTQSPKQSKAGEMAQGLRLVAFVEDLSSAPSNHTVAYNSL